LSVERRNRSGFISRAHIEKFHDLDVHECAARTLVCESPDSFPMGEVRQSGAGKNIKILEAGVTNPIEFEVRARSRTHAIDVGRKTAGFKIALQLRGELRAAAI
jgi:hypothetical protein